MRIAFDVHGVLDTFQSMRTLMQSLHRSGHEIFVISGQPLDSQMKQFLDTNDLTNSMDMYFSIETELLNNNVPWTDCSKGKFFPDEVWNPVKAQICDEHNIDMIFDNSVAYQADFDKIDTIFNLVVDK